MNTQSRQPPQNGTPRRNAVQRVADRYFHKQLDRLDDALAEGGIEASLPDGSFRILGCRSAGPVALVNLRSWRALVRLATGGSAGWYEAWDAREWASPDPVPLFDLFMRNRQTLGRQARASGVSRLTRKLLHRRNTNNRKGAKRNILAHYDLGNDFYSAWLDPTMSYSSAIFAQPMMGEEPLEDAQDRKCDALSARLLLAPQSSVLEIGCGWGHLATQLAGRGHDVSAITLSPSQRQWAEDAARDAEHRPALALCDYRDVSGQYDAIVSVEMVEAVGQDYWPEFIRTIARSLKPGGRAAIQFIMIADDVFDPDLHLSRRNASVRKPVPRACRSTGAALGRACTFRAALCRNAAALAGALRRCRRGRRAATAIR
jgi:cyclopropane-fatty-acyl-phospholipid synthase